MESKTQQPKLAECRELSWVRLDGWCRPEAPACMSQTEHTAKGKAVSYGIKYKIYPLWLYVGQGQHSFSFQSCLLLKSSSTGH